MLLDFEEACAAVLLRATALGDGLRRERVGIAAARGRILGEAVVADRDQPPFDRSTRDGFAVKAGRARADVSLRVRGSIRAGERWTGDPMDAGEAIEIMTGAPLPTGADAVAMVEATERRGDTVTLRGASPITGANVVRRRSEAAAGAAVLRPGTELGPAEIAVAASFGYAQLEVFTRPHVAVVATGDELVEVDSAPGPEQIRNSNSYALAALIEEVGGVPHRLPIAPDRKPELHQVLAQAREADLILLSGGVSMGRYDLVEEVLAELGAEFFFTGVRMQPGKPTVFGRLPAGAVGQSPGMFFGLPGNPISTEVTFRCFAAPLLRALAGAEPKGPRYAQATLGEDVPGKPGLMRLLPAHLDRERSRPGVRLVSWQGSGDLPANARANCYAVLPPDRESFRAGEVISVLLR